MCRSSNNINHIYLRGGIILILKENLNDNNANMNICNNNTLFSIVRNKCVLTAFLIVVIILQLGYNKGKYSR